MLYRSLGQSRLLVSEIGLGCAGYFGQRGFSDRRARMLVEQALELGINLFDTGHHYGNFAAEPRLGQALAQHDRDRVVISTKLGGKSRGSGWRPREQHQTHDFSPAAIEASCHAAIANLRCGYLDILQLHALPRDLLTEALLERLARMREQGLFRLLGVNSHVAADIRYFAGFDAAIDVVLLDYNALQLDREAEIALLDAAGIGVLAGTVLAQGHLVQRMHGKPLSGAWFWYAARSLLKPSTRRLSRLAGPIREILGKVPGMSPAQAAVAMVLDNPQVASCLVGTTDQAHLRELAAASGKSLPAASREAIRRGFAALPQSPSH